MRLPEVGNLLDISLGNGIVMRLEVFKHDEGRGWYIMRIRDVRKDAKKAAQLGDPREESIPMRQGDVPF